MNSMEYFLLAFCVGNTLCNALIIWWCRSYANHCTSTLEAHNKLLSRQL